MSKKIPCLLLVFTLLVLPAIQLSAASSPANADKIRLSGPVSSVLPGMPRFAPDRLLVKFKPGAAASERGKAHRQAGGKQLGAIPGIGVHVVEVPSGSALAVTTATFAPAL